jgi:glycogen debranching enzyme
MMDKSIVISTLIGILLGLMPLDAQEGTIPSFDLEANPITLNRLACPGTPFDKVGRKFAVLADEGGSFEAWAYPLKILRNFTFSFLAGNSTRPILARDIVRYVTVTPEATTLTFTYQSFTVTATFITPVDESGGIILLKVDSTHPLTIICGFLPVLQPMWPAGLGGQFAYWDAEQKAYIISESTGKNHGFIGSPAARGLSYTPAHMLSDVPNEFMIEIADPQLYEDKFIPIYMAGGKGQRKEVKEIYERLQNDPEKHYRKNLAHYKNLRRSTLRIQTPNKKLDLAFEWAKVAFDNLLVENPDLGKGLVAGLGASGSSGRPGFGWFFGGDAYINSFSLLSYGAHAEVRDILTFTQKWQRNDGKMAHELSQAEGYIDWWNDYHYGYIHGDTTPYYIAAMYDYARLTGDFGFIEASWQSLKRAFSWCLSTDANKDGLMDNKKAGLGALEYGALTGIQTDIYLAAVWVRSTYAMQRLAEIVGDNEYAARAAEQHQKAKRAFDAKFWDEENGFYAYAFNTEGKTVKEISPWNAIGSMWGLGTEERCLRSLERICTSELTTDWGIRSISINSRYFQPLNYNYGAVWPFLTSWVTSALFKHHMPQQGYSLLVSTANHTFEHALGSVTEVFSGTHNVWPQEAVSHQGFSTAGVVLPLVRGLLGLDGNAKEKLLIFSPHFPADWEHVSIMDYTIGQAKFSFDYQKIEDTISLKVRANNAEGYRIQFAPAMGIGSEFLSLNVDGNPVEVLTQQKAQVSLIQANIPVEDGAMELSIKFKPAVEILPVVTTARVGDSNQCLKIISIKKQASKLILKAEGLAGKNYELHLTNPHLITNVEGATLKNGSLILSMPDGQSGQFIAQNIIIDLRKESVK